MEKSNPIIFEGYAIVFNQPSVVLYERGERFREVIRPSAITQQFIREQDIVLNVRHDDRKILARSNKGVGDLKITVDNHGVKFHVEYDPDEDMFDTLAEARALIKRGTMLNCSCEFIPYPKDDDTANEYIPGKDGIPTLYRNRIYALTALTIAMYPAYPSTSVNTRENKRAYIYTEREVNLIESGQNLTNLSDLKFQRTRLQGMIYAAEARECAGQEIDVEAKLKVKAELHKVEAKIKELERGS